MTKYLFVKSELIKALHQFNPNDRFYSRALICRKFNISRATADKVITAMIQEKILYAIKGSGTFVSENQCGDTKFHSVKKLCEPISNWGVIVPNIMDDIFPSLVRGIEDFTKQHNINIIICNSDNNQKKEDEYIRRLAASGATGLIIVPTITRNQSQSGYDFLRKHQIPFVFCIRSIDSNISDIPMITSNDFYGGYIATRHLIANKYKRIGYLSKHQYITSINRYFGYAAALQEAGRAIERKHVVTDINDKNVKTERIIKRMMELPESPDAFFCHNDEIALEVYDALLSAGLRVSDDIGLIGYDNIRSCENRSIKLTSVSHKSYEIGANAAAVLYEQIQGSFETGFNITTFQPQLIVRDSCRGKKY